MTASASLRSRKNARPVGMFFAVGALVWVAVLAGNAYLPHGREQSLVVAPGEAPLAPWTRPVIGGWLHLDSAWYQEIAARGYSDGTVDEFHRGRLSAVAFFPAYPLVVRAVAPVVRTDYGVAELVTTAAFGLASALLFWHWCARRLSSGAQRYGLAMFLVYPYSWYLFGTGYGDVLFITSTIAAFLLVERGRYVGAGLAGAIATAARAVGMATAIGLIAVVLIQSGAVRREGRWLFDRSKLRPAMAWVCVSFAGIAAWCTYLWIRTGDALAFLTVQAARGWNQESGPYTWFKIAYWNHVFHGHLGSTMWLTIELLMTVLFLALVPRVVRRFGWGYGIYTVVVIGIPVIGSGDFQGLGRYLLAAFPVFAVIGELLAELPRARPVILRTSMLALLVLAALFARGSYLA